MKVVLRFTTILFALITLSALISHLLELPGKINLSLENYQMVQGIYKGWALLGIVEIAAIILLFAWIIVDRRNRNIFPFLLSALIFFIASLVIFFVFTFPTNTITANWTQLPKNWETLRETWEYSHAVRGILNLMGFCLLINGLLKEKNG
jgi:hypothetical protein